jgi:HAD superfamily phosphoserine phosphatase-like hydrolase
MSVGLFLDVDQTLTNGIIQHFFAREFGYESEFLEIEKEFQESGTAPKEFNSRLLPLMRRSGVTFSKLAEVGKKLPLQSWAEDLLKIEDAEIYLVSSGPNFYINNLAEKFGIPLERVYCSKYFFEEGTGLIQLNSQGVSVGGKADFVSQHAKKYAVSIGIGDDVTLDGPFISQCSLGFLTQPNESYFYAPNFELIRNTIRILSRSLTTANTTIVSSVDQLTELSIFAILKSLKVSQVAWLFAAIVGYTSAVYAISAFIVKFIK